MAKRAILLAIVTAVTVAVVVPITVFGLPAGNSDPDAFSHLHVDANPNNGTRPCDPLDSTRTVQVGDTYDVALCLETYAPNKLEAFKLRLYYDMKASNLSINTAPDPQGAEEPAHGGTGPDCGSCLDDNPDANDTKAPDTNDPEYLGSDWDCSGFTVFPPVGDDVNTPCQDQYGQPITPCHDAVIICNANIGMPDLDLSADPGLLATVRFTATGEGTELLTWGDDTELVGSDLVLPAGSSALCGPEVPESQIGCFGATINKVVFDCVWEDSFGRGTYLGLLGNDWEFGYSEGTLSGTGRVMRFGDRAFVFGRGQGFYVAGFGTCPSGPGSAFALDFTSFPPHFLRVRDVTGPVD